MLKCNNVPTFQPSNSSVVAHIMQLIGQDPCLFRKENAQMVERVSTTQHTVTNTEPAVPAPATTEQTTTTETRTAAPTAAPGTVNVNAPVTTETGTGVTVDATPG